MSHTVTTAQPAQARSDVQSERTGSEGWTIVPDAELARLRALEEAVQRWTAANRAAYPPETMHDREPSPPRPVVSRSVLRRLELQVMALSDAGRASR